MKKSVYRIILFSLALTSSLNATELTIIVYRKKAKAVAEQFLKKIICTITKADTIETIKQKILAYNSEHNNCLNLSGDLTIDQIPVLLHMNRTRSKLDADEIAFLPINATLSITFQLDESNPNANAVLIQDEQDTEMIDVG